MAVGRQIKFLRNRNSSTLLIVHANGTIGNQLRQTLKTQGYRDILLFSNQLMALERIKARGVDLVFFDAQPMEIPSQEFVKKSLELDSSSILIALSGQPKVDDVFSLLRVGARGFLVTPFVVDKVEEVLTGAAEGPALSESVLNAPDRNAALTGVVLNNLYRVSDAMHQARKFDGAKRELERLTYLLHQSMELAKLFCEGGDEALVERIMETCIAQANVNATRLGRTRKKLRSQRERNNGEIIPPQQKTVL